MPGRRSAKTSMIVLVVTGAMVISGVLLAFVGENTPQWGPPPLPKAWEAPAFRLSVQQAASAGAASQRQPSASGTRGRRHQHVGRSAGPIRRPPASRGAAASRRSQPAVTPAPARGVIPAQTPRPTPTAAAGRAPESASTPDPTRTASPAGRQPGSEVAPLARSVPLSIEIPAIGVRASVIELGLQSDGTMAVPPLAHPFLTGWFDRGPTPGQPGTAVIVGHVDAVGVGPAVFYRLGDLLPGERIYVTLANRSTAVFQVWAAALYPKAGFPLGAVYGYTAEPSLRLITCGGVFNPQTGHYLSNIVVYANYVGAT